MKNVEICRSPYPWRYSLVPVTCIGDTLLIEPMHGEYVEGTVTALSIHKVVIFCKDANKEYSVKWDNVLVNKSK